jgi:NAD(P)-dependent dehydrogenase (short-subunit alcohol dehydrogenase family)
MGRLEGKTAVVTGGTSGNGWPAAKRFLHKPLNAVELLAAVQGRSERPSGRLERAK